MKELDPKEMIKAYQKSFKEFGESPSSLLIPKGRQELRFNSFLPYINKNSTLLDFGCGFSDLAKFLVKRKLNIKYHGCDLIEEFLEISKKKYPKYTFFTNLSKIKKSGKIFDTIICAGAFNFLYCDDEKKHFEHVKKILLNLFSLARINLIVDFQTEFVDFKVSNSYHQNISELINFITKNLSRRFSFDHSYMPYEFNVNIMKENKIDKNMNVYKKIILKREKNGYQKT